MSVMGLINSAEADGQVPRLNKYSQNIRYVQNMYGTILNALYTVGSLLRIPPSRLVGSRRFAKPNWCFRARQEFYLDVGYVSHARQCTSGARVRHLPIRTASRVDSARAWKMTQPGPIVSKTSEAIVAPAPCITTQRDHPLCPHTRPLQSAWHG